jgi:hypothetical protein
LQRYRLQINGARLHHAPVQRNDQVSIIGKTRKFSANAAIRRHVGALAHREPGDHREVFGGHGVLGRPRFDDRDPLVGATERQERLCGARSCVAHSCKGSAKA